MPKPVKPKAPQLRFGIGEWYGVPLTSMTAAERRNRARIECLPKAQRPATRCPFQKGADCNKVGGVCSLRLYQKSLEIGLVTPASGEDGQLRTVCPARFEEDQMIYRWVGETILGTSDPTVVGEIGFLESPLSPKAKAVGRIDRILAVPKSSPLLWCAVEVQAVYFQGLAITNDFEVIRNHTADSLPFPHVLRRPDYRSSGPKRLMPQLQIKVPTLSRWGKKMAVVVDRAFFLAMGKMRTVPHITNCDVAWFVVRYSEREAGKFRLERDGVHFTTLADSVEGLTAGTPVSLEVFEKRILDKLQRLSGPVKIAPH